MQSKLAQVSLLANRASDYLRDDNRRAYVVIENQCREFFPNYLDMFHVLVNSSNKSIHQVGESDPFKF